MEIKSTTEKMAEFIKSPAEKMAEFIIINSVEHCAVCAEFERCEAEMRKLSRAADDVNYTPPLPPKSHCIANIIKYFEG